jgi:predicted nucleic acid-binding protein
MDDAWRVYDDLLRDPRVVFAEEPEDIETAWRSFTQGQAFSTNVWSDAYLAAFAQIADLQIVTFDRGFAKFKNVKQKMLS